jgi:hypothetical protein
MTINALFQAYAYFKKLPLRAAHPIPGMHTAFERGYLFYIQNLVCRAGCDLKDCLATWHRKWWMDARLEKR